MDSKKIPVKLVCTSSDFY